VRSTCGFAIVELPRLDGHLILGETWRKEALVGRPAKYPTEFRREAVALVKSSGRPVAEVARSLEIAEGTLWNWVKLDRDEAERLADPNALSESEREELRRLRKKTAQQEIDLEILRKAAAYFARETNR
jgi:transposase